MRKLSGNHAGWLAAVAREIREAGKPASLDLLAQVVPGQFATSTNDGHVTAAENGFDRNDFRAGQRIWVEESVAALRKAGLIAGPDDALVWVAGQDGEWQVPFRRARPTVYGRAETLAARDRHMLGERTEPIIKKDSTEALRGHLLGWSEVEVEVAGGGGDRLKPGRRTLQVHPLAFTIPAMTRVELDALRTDVEKHGVRQPLVLFADPSDTTARGTPRLKVLDGRHRLQIASSLGKPVRVEVFDGDREEAAALVLSLNLHRRHLNTAQRHLVAVRLFEQIARQEAHAAKTGALKQNAPFRPIDRDGGEAESDAGEWHERAAKKAGGKEAGITGRGVERMSKVAKAPETAAEVDAGNVKTVKAAAEKARRELGETKPSKPPERLWPTTVRRELGMMRGHGEAVLRELDLPVGTNVDGEIAGVLSEIERIVADIRGALAERGVL